MYFNNHMDEPKNKPDYSHEKRKEFFNHIFEQMKVSKRHPERAMEKEELDCLIKLLVILLMKKLDGYYNESSEDKERANKCNTKRCKDCHHCWDEWEKEDSSNKCKKEKCKCHFDVMDDEEHEKMKDRHSNPCKCRMHHSCCEEHNHQDKPKNDDQKTQYKEMCSTSHEVNPHFDKDEKKHQPNQLKKKKKENDMQEKIWLTEMVASLYNESLFKHMESSEEQDTFKKKAHSKQCQCHQESTNHEEYSKGKSQFNYGDLPLGSMKKKTRFKKYDSDSM